jgi:hypothetical protein
MNREDSWENAHKQMQQMLARDFPACEYLKLTVLSKECYEAWQPGESRYPGIDMLDCYATYELGKNPCCYMQHYVKLTEGVYITSKEKDFILEEGDLTLIEADIAKEQINDYNINAATPFYHIRFSNRIKKQIGNELSVYLRFVPEEAEFPENMNFYCYIADEDHNYYYASAISTDYADAGFTILKESYYYFIGSRTTQDE